MKKAILSILGILVLIVIGGYATVMNVESVQDRIIKGATSQAGLGKHLDVFDEDRMSVLLCGTGSPLPDPERAGPCTAVFAGGQFFIVDTGVRVTRRMNSWQIPMDRLSAVLLTHFHSDHIAELGEVTMYSWAGGRPEILPVYGPEGVERVANGFREAYALDTSYRLAHHGAELMDTSIVGPEARPFTLSESEQDKVIYEKNDVKITAFSVDHNPIEPAVGYRFDYKGRSVVISGDTVKDANLIRVSQGADLLIHEALASHIVKEISANAEANGNHRLSKITADILDYHTTPVEAAEAAQEAGVGMLVYSHIVPPIINRFVARVFLRDTDDSFDGPIILGEDGMLFTLKAGETDIEQGRI